jgi:hypothetical protein
MKQANRLPALFEKRPASVDGFSVQRKGAGADGTSEEIGPRRGFARLDIENHLARASLVG